MHVNCSTLSSSSSKTRQLLERCRAIIKTCRAVFSSNRNSSSSPPLNFYCIFFCKIIIFFQDLLIEMEGFEVLHETLALLRLTLAPPPISGDGWTCPMSGDRWTCPMSVDRWTWPRSGDRWTWPMSGDRWTWSASPCSWW